MCVCVAAHRCEVYGEIARDHFKQILSQNLCKKKTYHKTCTLIQHIKTRTHPPHTIGQMLHKDRHSGKHSQQVARVPLPVHGLDKAEDKLTGQPRPHCWEVAGGEEEGEHGVDPPPLCKLQCLDLYQDERTVTTHIYRGIYCTGTVANSIALYCVWTYALLLTHIHIPGCVLL